MSNPHNGNEAAGASASDSVIGQELRSVHRKTESLPPEARQRVLQEELYSLISVVGAAPLVELLLERAFELGATDIHFDPQRDGLHIRMRLDGVLHNILRLDQQYVQPVISRVKLLANMDITDRRTAQDGRISSQVLRHRRDVRVGSGPTIHGERVVMRLMPDDSQYVNLAQLGMNRTQIEQVDRGIRCPYGVILSVGPVGSGKSTTTYTCLSALNDPQRSLVTIEDPVERRIDGVNQVQIDTRYEFGFVEALRGILRQDPDVIMIGEIRDAETAHIAIRAGLTGTRVLSTLHAGDTGSTIDMFREFQVPRMFLADAIKCVIAQRLLRKVCTKDREYFAPDVATSEFLKLSPEQAREVRLARGIPSDANFHTGYFGRTGIFEVMSVDGEVRDMLLGGKPGRTISDFCHTNGMISLEESAREKVLDGVTSVEEVIRMMI
ncbi:GspE/PulE family protein [Planctomicrobium piriforme]|uniref:General secretion pathway protein E/type IV pilus assembly protein PilB n=1 Tax=Planctomicrobium piriforme TaxID=1576369 RepID=A0A1I3T9I8_9PLAN|nr:GspE/PulE family protein [Planctomicrobium piriforme]SFJ66999.1 general secretion pathway protein E/type IV pilus assembly protein PilB [Planctomicrobium piriforme]